MDFLAEETYYEIIVESWKDKKDIVFEVILKEENFYYDKTNNMTSSKKEFGYF